ncbi:hypothetical protein DTJ15_06595 [Parasaccharibacter sp. TMW 2.1891]|nr:hypothetical protein [Parasaccharibacter sp. TMW 2.1891]
MLPGRFLQSSLLRSPEELFLSHNERFIMVHYVSKTAQYGAFHATGALSHPLSHGLEDDCSISDRRIDVSIFHYEE